MVTLPAVKAKPLIREHRIPTPASKPYIITLGPDGNVWFSETDVGQMARITSSGVVSEYAAGITAGSQPLAITVAGKDLWFSEAAGNRIGKITMGGLISEYPAPSLNSGPRAVIVIPDGRVFFFPYDAGQIGEIIPAK
jgi:virginiamycin B lyase